MRLTCAIAAAAIAAAAAAAAAVDVASTPRVAKVDPACEGGHAIVHRNVASYDI